MQALGPRELLSVWEWGEDRHPVDRSLALLAGACPERTWEELAALPVGRRDALLLELRRRSFGPLLEAVAPCSDCGETVELAVEIERLLERGPREAGAGEVTVSHSGWELAARLPDSRDLAALAGCRDLVEGRTLLARRCILTARRHGADGTPEEIPERVLEALAARLEALDPLAVIELEAACPACGASGSLLLDPGDLLWAEVRTEARRLLREVDALARLYGWGEDEILALGPRRRRAYLELGA